MQGFDEVFNVLLEHSFRYFGPESEITKQILNDTSWHPTNEPNENGLVNLVDVNLRENNDAYLNYLYIIDYYIFDHFHSKIKSEIDNPKNESIQIENLDFSFDEEELRKVMGNIGHLLLKEPSLLNSVNYDYVNLYFQIKKLWSILITLRYLNEGVNIKVIMNRVQKSFAIKQLQEIDKINVIIENYLKSFEEIYETKESINKHIKEFFEEFCLRYFKYITIGLSQFIKDFRHTISLKFTSVDLIKENLNNLNATDEFHQLLIDFLATNNLQTENDMQQFLVLIREKRNILTGFNNELPEDQFDNGLPDNFNVNENLDSLCEIDNALIEHDDLNNENQERINQEIEANPNLNEISLHETNLTQLSTNNTSDNDVNPTTTTIINNDQNIDNFEVNNDLGDSFNVNENLDNVCVIDNVVNEHQESINQEVEVNSNTNEINLNEIPTNSTGDNNASQTSSTIINSQNTDDLTNNSDDLKNNTDAVSTSNPQLKDDSNTDDEVDSKNKIEFPERTITDILKFLDNETPTKNNPKSTPKSTPKTTPKSNPKTKKRISPKSPKLDQSSSKATSVSDESTDLDDDITHQVLTKTKSKKVVEIKKTPKKRAYLSDSSDDENRRTTRRSLDKRKNSNKSTVNPSETIIDTPRKGKKRIESESSSSNERVKRFKDDDDIEIIDNNNNGDIDTVDDERISEIVNNQPIIILKPIGKLKHNNEILPVFN